MAAAAAWRPAAGRAIPGRPGWELAERLGEGGGGEVWLARHPSGEARAFKFCSDATQLAALKREVTLFRVLRDALGDRPDVARILDWRFAEEPSFVASELTAEGSLPRWAERQGGLAALPAATRLRLAAEVAAALGAAHAVGILHRDVKPSNVLVRCDGDGAPHAVLADFGIGLLQQRERLAAAGDKDASTADAVAADAIKGSGTLGYLAPELLAGEAPTLQADLYAFGVLLYQLAAGSFERTMAPGWERDVEDGLLAEDIAALVDGRPERRPSSAAGVAEKLRRLEQRRAARVAAAERERALARARQRRRRASGAASVAGVLLLVAAATGLREFRARRAAEAAEARAAQRQNQAEELVGFLLGDLRGKLAEVGRLDLLDAVGGQAMAYFATVPVAELSDAELARRAKALYQIGEVRLGQGRLPEAGQAFAAAARLGEALVARDPDHGEWAFELAQSRFWLGQVAWNRRELVAAREQFAAYLAIAESRLAREPADAGWQLEVAYATAALATVLEDLGEAAAAERQLRRSIAIKEGLVRQDPGKAEWQASLANGLAWLAALSSARGRLAEAREILGREGGLRRELRAGDAANALFRTQLATSQSQLGQILLDLGDLEGARREIEESLTLAGELAAGDPGNQERRRDLAVALREHAEVLAVAGEHARARSELQRAATILGSLVARDATQAEWERQLAITATVQAELALREGRAAAAVARARAALARLAPRLAADAEDPKLRRFVAQAGIALGRGLAASGRQEEARRAWQSARASLGGPSGERRSLYDRAPLAKLLLLLDERQEARPLVEKLRANGYARPDFVALCRQNGIP